jgi:archaeosortase B (VPXXXP-CTERM-specific)
MLVFLLSYSRLTGSALFDEFRGFTAEATGFVLNLFGGDVLVAGTMVSSPDFSMGIIEACTGIVPMAIFVSAVLAYPSTIRQKAIGIVLGILGLYAVNLVRTATLFVVGTHFYSFFDTAHYLVWQSLMVFVAVVFWLLWMSRLYHVAPE